LIFQRLVMLFLPGTYYKTLYNQPLTAEQFAYIQALKQVTLLIVPLLGADARYTFNIGLEWAF